MFSGKDSARFQKDKCDLCGDCLVECQYVDYSREKAVSEIQALINGERGDILRECVTCMACNEICPQDADPFDLIITTIEKKQPFMVPPPVFEMFGQATSLPSLVAPGAKKELALSVCAVEPMIHPNLLAHPAFADMTVVKGADYFCYLGAIHILMGNTLPAKARTLIDNLSALGAEEIVFLHDECYAMVAKKAPEYGIEVPFKSKHILEHLNDYLKKNPSRVHPLGRKVAFQRPCSSRYMPGGDALVDEFLGLVGVERVQRQYDRKAALCCGAAIMGAGKLALGMEIQMKNLEDAREHGGEAIAYLCPMCGMILREICEETQYPAVSLFDLFLEATP